MTAGKVESSTGSGGIAAANAPDDWRVGRGKPPTGTSSRMGDRAIRRAAPRGADQPAIKRASPLRHAWLSLWMWEIDRAKDSHERKAHADGDQPPEQQPVGWPHLP